MISSLVTTPPFAAANTHNMSIARLPSCTTVPSRHSPRRPRASRKAPNLTSSPLLGLPRKAGVQNNQVLNLGLYEPAPQRRSVILPRRRQPTTIRGPEQSGDL